MSIPAQICYFSNKLSFCDRGVFKDFITVWIIQVPVLSSVSTMINDNNPFPITIRVFMDCLYYATASSINIFSNSSINIYASVSFINSSRTFTIRPIIFKV